MIPTDSAAPSASPTAAPTKKAVLLGAVASGSSSELGKIGAPAKGGGGISPLVAGVLVVLLLGGGLLVMVSAFLRPRTRPRRLRVSWQAAPAHGSD